MEMKENRNEMKEEEESKGEGVGGIIQAQGERQ